jgi:hypothetical protein
MGWWSQSILFPHEGRFVFQEITITWAKTMSHEPCRPSLRSTPSPWRCGAIGCDREIHPPLGKAWLDWCSQLYYYPVLRLLGVIHIYIICIYIYMYEYIYIYMYIYIWVGYNSCEITHFLRVVQETNMHLIWPANLQYSFWFYRLDVWLKTDVKQSPVALFSRLKAVPRKQLANSLIVHLFHIGFAPALSQLGQIHPPNSPCASA